MPIIADITDEFVLRQFRKAMEMFQQHNPEFQNVFINISINPDLKRYEPFIKDDCTFVYMDKKVLHETKEIKMLPIYKERKLNKIITLGRKDMRGRSGYTQLINEKELNVELYKEKEIMSNKEILEKANLSKNYLKNAFLKGTREIWTENMVIEDIKNQNVRTVVTVNDIPTVQQTTTFRKNFMGYQVTLEKKLIHDNFLNNKRLVVTELVDEDKTGLFDKYWMGGMDEKTLELNLMNSHKNIINSSNEALVANAKLKKLNNALKRKIKKLYEQINNLKEKIGVSIQKKEKMQNRPSVSNPDYIVQYENESSDYDTD